MAEPGERGEQGPELRVGNSDRMIDLSQGSALVYGQAHDDLRYGVVLWSLGPGGRTWRGGTRGHRGIGGNTPQHRRRRWPARPQPAGAARPARCGVAAMSLPPGGLGVLSGAAAGGRRRWGIISGWVARCPVRAPWRNRREVPTVGGGRGEAARPPSRPAL